MYILDSNTIYTRFNAVATEHATISFLLFLFAIITIRSIVIRHRLGLRHVPGPFLASVSDFDRIWSCASGSQMNYHLQLHEEYGRLVRIGPNHVSFSESSLITQIYGIRSSYLKSDFYKLFDIVTPVGNLPTLFSEREGASHKAMKRQVVSAYTMSTMKNLEPMNDECSAILSRKLENFVGQDIDLGQWLHWYAWDVISSITFSNRLGFMETESDIHNIIHAIEKRLVYNSVIGQAPYLHRFLFGNTIVSRLASLIPAIAALNSSRYIVEFTLLQLQRYHKKEFNTVQLDDLLDRLRRFKDGQETMSESQLLIHASANIFAGSDTTASALRAIFYYLCRNPESHDKLLVELDEAEREGRLSDPVTFEEAQELTYLQAVIKEALRMHPAVGLLLERVVPIGGADILGHWLPEGTIIGINPWVAARDKAVYGDDAFSFRPERWLEADENSLKLMERNFLAFGGGTRTCLGKNVSLLEISKLVPQILRRFDFKLSVPKKQWIIRDYWFAIQSGLICKVIRRK